jgi:hypothetical protein
MVRTLALLLPALAPSWRFFARVVYSPRVEFAVLGSADDTPRVWREFRPRPAHLPLHAMLRRLVWNPRWNESLFLVSCCERFLDRGAQRNIDEILARIADDLRRAGSAGAAPAHSIQVRIVLLSREGDRILRAEVYRSPVLALDGHPAA